MPGFNNLPLRLFYPSPSFDVLARAVVHQDVAARNLLLQTNAMQQLTVKVCDFGLSHIKKHHEDISSVSSAVWGAFPWMAPESFSHASGIGQCSKASDVFMFGCTILEVLTGQSMYT